MELKIVCQCGQKYKFDLEPVNGRMPFTVKCPICNVDGTETANDALARQFAVPAPTPPAAPIFKQTTPLPVAAAAPAPFQSVTPPPPAPLFVAPQASPPAPPPPPQIGGLRINKAQEPEAAVAPPPPLPPVAGARPSPPAAIRGARMASPVKVRSGEYNLGRGIGGAVIGTIVGCALMYAFFYFVQFRFPLMGTGVGLLAGLGARWLARGTDSTLGIISGALAGASVAGTLVLMYGDFPMGNIVSVIICGVVANRIAS